IILTTIGDKQNARQLAKELVRSRKAKENIYKSKAQLNSVSMQLSQNLAMMKVAGVMQRSTQIMAMMVRQSLAPLTPPEQLGAHAAVEPSDDGHGTRDGESK